MKALFALSLLTNAVLGGALLAADWRAGQWEALTERTQTNTAVCIDTLKKAAAQLEARQ